MVMLQFMWIIWDIERDNIRLRTIDWKVTKARKWYYVWWWKTPFGYDLHSTPWWKKLKINNDEAKIVNRIYDMYINDDLSLWEIARRLTIEWIPTRDDRLKIRIEKDNSNIDKYKDKYKEENNGLEIDISHKKWTKKEKGEENLYISMLWGFQPHTFAGWKQRKLQDSQQTFKQS